MKRITVLAILTALLALWTIAAWAGAPQLVDFQGILRDGSGNPVANGNYSVTFKIYDAAVGGATLWTETQTVTTSSGLFTALLGSNGTPVPDAAFSDTTRYLGITVSPDPEMTPRQRLVSVGYGYRVNSVDKAAGGTINGDLSFDLGDGGPVEGRINVGAGAANLELYDTGDLNANLFGDEYGELQLRDLDADLTADLNAQSSSGGVLTLNQEDGTAGVLLRGGSTSNGATLSMRNTTGSATISLDADLTGNSAAIFPIDAISASEERDEPGVASNTGTAFIIMDGTTQTLLSRSVSVTAGGYVLVIGTMTVYLNHTNGLSSWGEFGISDVAGSFPTNQQGTVLISDNATTGLYRNTVTVHGLFSVAAGTSTFYLLGDELSGDLSVRFLQLSLIYFPTAYGTVTPTVAGALQNVSEETAPKRGGLTPNEIATEQTEAEVFNAARMEKELAQMKTERVLLEERLQKLEAQMTQRKGLTNDQK